MRLSIDISQSVYKGTGVGRFTKELTNTIVQLDNQNEWTFLFSSLRQKLDKYLEETINNSRHRLIKLFFPPSFLSYLWNTKHIIKVEKIIGKQDFFISSDWLEPPSTLKKVTIVHDLVFIRYPTTVHPKIINNQKKRLEWLKKESKIIFVDTHSTKADLIKFYNIDENRIIVNYPGISAEKPKKKIIEQTLDSLNIKTPFILAVGKLEPRKNLETLITAFAKRKEKNTKLVIVGPDGWNVKKIKSEGVLWTGYLDDEKLYSLYCSALVFIYPSLWEGFGYPILEAMKLGCPVGTSNRSSMKELAEGAAVLFDPESEIEITKAIDRISSDQNLRKSLIKKGYERVEKFTWKKYLDKMLKELEKKRIVYKFIK